ncbi:MAG: DUF4132 domain-containing protein [Ancrocorticia sp.]
MGILDKLFGKGKQVQRDALAEALWPVSAISPEMYGRMVGWVRSGDGPEILLELERQPNSALANVLASPAHLGYFHVDQATADVWERIAYSREKVRLARHRYYASNPDPAELIRFAKLLIPLASAVGTIDRRVDGVPAWVTVLLNDVACTMIEDPSVGLDRTTFSEIRNNLEKGLRFLPHWQPGYIPSLLIEDGMAPEEAASAAILAFCQSGNAYSYAQLDPHHLPGLDGLLAQWGHHLLPEQAARLGADGRTLLMARAAKHADVAEGISRVVAAFAVDTAKGPRNAAFQALERLSEQTLDAVLIPVLVKTAPSKSKELVKHLGRNESTVPLLDRALEAGAKIAAGVEQATQLRHALESTDTSPAVPTSATDPSADVLIASDPGPTSSNHASLIPLPPFEPIPDVRLGEQTMAELRQWTASEIERYSDPESDWQRERVKRARSYRDSHFRAFIAVANGEGSRYEALSEHNTYTLRRAVPSLNLIHVLRLRLASSDPHLDWSLHSGTGRDVDFRAIEDAVRTAGAAADQTRGGITEDQLLSYARNWPAEYSWAWFSQRLPVLRQWLSGGPEEMSRALTILKEFPSLPESLAPLVAEIALSQSKTLRPLAQAALANHPSALSLAIHGLEDGRGEIRTAAASWIARQLARKATSGSASEGEGPTNGGGAVVELSSGINALQAALKKERREGPKAAILSALEQLGIDISANLAPEVLLAEAHKGLKAKPPAALAWFDLDALPSVHWADGSAVDPAILRWWTILAHKLKNPDGSGLLDRYLSLLDSQDAAKIGRFILSIWVARDTRHPSEEECHEYGERNGPIRWQSAQDYYQRSLKHSDAAWAEWARAQADLSLEHYIHEQYRVKQAEYLGSATPDKGLLALTTRMPGIELANEVQAYIRANGARRTQIEALVHALFANGDPAALQLLLSISRRFKQATVQAKAKELVERLAELRGWSTEELADRTIPTAGFSDDRLLHLSFGEREFIGRVNAKYGIELCNPEGKVIKALPKPRLNDDEEAAAEARKQLTAARKELKAVMTLQRSRLYEAMCLARTWPAKDWQEFLLRHPLMSQLIPRLIWQELAADGSMRQFRPTEDGELLDINDDAVALAADSRVQLAHRIDLSEDEAQAWVESLSDYEVVPLFDQLGAELPSEVPSDLSSLDTSAVAFEELAGHITDSFSFRGVATKRGYLRGSAEDGGWFSEYTKEFSAAGITAVLEFTGAFLPEENIPCATRSLYFRRGMRRIPLKAVPPRLLAECHADYAAVAALGPYDPDYEKNTRY